jgi:DNA-binding NarL/FixJ family response regulator
MLVLIASSDTTRVTRWRRALPREADVIVCPSYVLAEEAIARDLPDFVLLDWTLPVVSEPGAVRTLRDRSPGSQMIVMSDVPDDDVEIELFAAGVRGCCAALDDVNILRRAIHSVSCGELWIRRVLIAQLVDRLTRRDLTTVRSSRLSNPAATVLLRELTPREHEVAELVSHGGTNKEIAHSLAITERTVKAHLTEIFRKLGIDDRVKLAVMMMSESFAGRGAPALDRAPPTVLANAGSVVRM